MFLDCYDRAWDVAMHDRSKYSLFFTSLIVVSILISSVMLVGSQASSTKHQIPEDQILKIEPQDHFTSSYIVRSPIVITSNADFESLGFPGNGSALDPYLIENYNITTEGASVSIADTDAYFIIQNCLLTSGTTGAGIDLDTVVNGEIRNNIISGCILGIVFHDSVNTIVANNIITGNDFGFQFFTHSNNNTVVNNTIYENGSCGAYISGSSENTVRNNTIIGSYDCVQITASNNTVVNNTISGTRRGVYLFGYSNNKVIGNTIFGNERGVFAYRSTNNTVENNTISGNDYGIKIEWLSDNNTIVGNTIFSNEDGIHISYSVANNISRNIIKINDYGVKISNGGTRNLFYLNILDSNFLYNAYDYETENDWNITGTGNYWSDYNGTGTYTISGLGGSIDYHPIFLDSVAPIIDHPLNVEYVVETTGHSITWTLYEENPSNYVIFRNDAEVISNIWDGNPIIVNADGLSVGVYNYTIAVHDTSGNTVSDIVLVTVLSLVNTTPTTTTSSTTGTGTSDNSGDFTLIILGIGGVGAVLIVVILLKFRKQS